MQLKNPKIVKINDTDGKHNKLDLNFMPTRQP